MATNPHPQPPTQQWGKLKVNGIGFNFLLPKGDIGMKALAEKAAIDCFSQPRRY